MTCVLCAGALGSLWRLARCRNSPTEVRGCLLSTATLLLFVAALWAQTLGQSGLALAACALAIACAVGWLLHIYRQSLHNTTM